MASSGRLESLETTRAGAPDHHQNSKPCTPYQKVSGITAMVFAVVAFVMIVAFANGSEYSNGYLGGINFSDLLFNWHPILMMGGFNFCAIYAMVKCMFFITQVLKF